MTSARPRRSWSAAAEKAWLEDAQAEVTVEVEHQGRTYRGLGVSTDSVEASGRAFLNAINRVAMLQGVAI